MKDIKTYQDYIQARSTIIRDYRDNYEKLLDDYNTNLQELFGIAFKAGIINLDGSPILSPETQPESLPLDGQFVDN